MTIGGTRDETFSFTKFFAHLQSADVFEPFIDDDRSSCHACSVLTYRRYDRELFEIERTFRRLPVPLKLLIDIHVQSILVAELAASSLIRLTGTLQNLPHPNVFRRHYADMGSRRVL